ncbi:predicted integral membrane protein DUF2269 [Bacillus oleivorans]|uniref:Predicted integral membrane protein DUF2269 n=1 Tax=Bacillus oleivorans TaxID=1448271 RepID=A0A285D564_9BACI|nr:predicted integral membrane protein DUF2269 [Bacillus oleivorans]
MAVIFYKFIVYIHIFSAILSIGPFFVLLPLLKKLRSAEIEEIPPYLNVFTSSIRLVKHAGHVLVISGVLLIYMGGWPWSTTWIVMTLVVMFSSIIFLARAFTPTIKKFAEPDFDQGQLAEKLRRSVWVYIVLLLVMLWFMVVKPVWW